MKLPPTPRQCLKGKRIKRPVCHSVDFSWSHRRQHTRQDWTLAFLCFHLSLFFFSSAIIFIIKWFCDSNNVTLQSRKFVFMLGAWDFFHLLWNMFEDSVKVTFDQVLEQVRWVLQVALPEELCSLFQQMLDAQVFPSYHYLALSKELHCLSASTSGSGRAGETDLEDLARRMALPMWQRWDTCQGILQSVLNQEVDTSWEFTSTSSESGEVSVGFVYILSDWHLRVFYSYFFLSNFFFVLEGICSFYLCGSFFVLFFLHSVILV